MKSLRREFPLLSSAAAWTGGIANQNRGTIGGNIVNASPAADSLPALLVYDAELDSGVSARRAAAALSGFHTGYKKTQLAPDELIRAVCLPRRFSGYVAYTRKVGARNAQAISKVCIAALGRLANGVSRRCPDRSGKCRARPASFDGDGTTVTGKPIDLPICWLWRRKTAAARSSRLTIFDLPRDIAQRWRAIWWLNFSNG